MLDHIFNSVPHYRIGPLRNPMGYLIAIAEIDELWLFRCESPDGEAYTAYFSTHEEVIKVIQGLNNLRSGG